MTNQKDKLYNELLARKRIHFNLKETFKQILSELEHQLSLAEEEMTNAQERYDGYCQEGYTDEVPYVHDPIEITPIELHNANAI